MQFFEIISSERKHITFNRSLIYVACIAKELVQISCLNREERQTCIKFGREITSELNSHHYGLLSSSDHELRYTVDT